MKAFFVTLMMTVLSTAALAAHPSVSVAPKAISKMQVLRSIATDSIGRAALKQLKGCDIKLVKAPKGDTDLYEVEGSCMQEPDEYIGGGIYLSITIKGQYFTGEAGAAGGEVKSVEMMHAG